jgi:hypothetical protein
VVVQEAVQAVVVVPVDVVEGDLLDVGDGAQWAGAERGVSADGFVLVQADDGFGGGVEGGGVEGGGVEGGGDGLEFGAAVS